MSIIEELDRYITKDTVNGCWLWTAHRLVRVGKRKTERASRLVFTRERGTIPPDTHLRRRCKSKQCCNPDHFELVEPSCELKTCTQCGRRKAVERFGLKRDGSNNRRSACSSCNGTNFTEWNKRLRASGDGIDRWIFADSRKHDKKRGFDNNLTRKLIRELISNPCSYCGNSELRMTLDRIDNSKGHTTDNVLPACVRCNYIRRDMPYEAWLSIVPSIRNTYKSGLFGKWMPGPTKNNRLRNGFKNDPDRSIA